MSDRKKTEEKEEKKYSIDIDDLLYESRQLFLYEVIDSKSAKRINKELLGLAELDNKKPIAIWINSPGGSVVAGYSIIDTMKGLPCPIYTFICGYACSMAGIISIVGDKRVMTKNSIWMAHEMTTGGYDYAQKIWDRTDYQKKLAKDLKKFIVKHTKLTAVEVDKAWAGELWLNATQCKKKGIIDYIARG